MATDLWRALLRQIESDDGSAPNWIYLTLLVVVSVSLAFKLFADGAEKLIKSWEQIQNTGFLFLRSTSVKTRIRKRRLFLQVLKADLEIISKKESWNDQSFADLEGEAEYEGTFFSSRIARLRKSQTRGLTRVPSLTEAIYASAERYQLVLGDPGSGKSVALRHLASKLIDAALCSGRTHVRIPLYVNFRELDRARYPTLDASAIRTFILDNVRRDSTATVEFIEANWDEFCERGSWFFIFDSFDEIPEVLHSDAHDATRKAYSDALSAFLKTTGDCRAVVASREFKGPDALEWDRIKIVPLTFSKQEQLIRRSLINDDQKRIAILYLSEYDGQLYRNPLFLTLLCRYVGLHNAPPRNDYDLLASHVTDLIRRDSGYVQRVYGIVVDDLEASARDLAAALALNPKLGLSPTRGDLELCIERDSFLHARLDEVLAALTSCKVLRRDLSESSVGAPKYTFSHRRYQETLFVTFVLQTNRSDLKKRLVSEFGWREYLVTLLQGRSGESIAGFVEEIGKRLRVAFGEIRTDFLKLKGRENITYVDWKRSPVTYYLNILLEGFRGKYEALPEGIIKEVEQFLGKVWNGCDITDQYIVIKFAPLCSEEFSLPLLKTAVDSSSAILQAEAFSKVGYLKNPDSDFSAYVRKRFSNQVLIARTRAEQLRMEALAGRISHQVGCDAVYHRSYMLRKIFGWAIRACSAVERPVANRSWWIAGLVHLFFGKGGSVIPALCVWTIVLGASFLVTMRPSDAWLSWPAFGITAIVVTVWFILIGYIMRDEPDGITWRKICVRLRRWVRGLRHSRDARAFIAFIVVLTPFLGLAFWVNSGFDMRLNWVEVCTMGAFAGIVSLFFAVWIATLIEKEESAKALKSAENAALEAGPSLLL